MREGPGCLETRAFRVLGAKGVVVIPKQDAPGQSRSRKVVPATPAMSRPDLGKPAGELIQHGLDGHGHSMLVRKDPGDGTDLPPNVGMRCCGLPASSRQCGPAVWAGRPLMRRLRIRRNRRTRTRSPTTEVASTDARRTNFPVSCRHSRTPIIRHGRPAKDEADLSSLRGAHEARQATALARPQTPSDPPVSVHRLRACRHGRVARVRRRGALNELRDSLGAHHTCGYRLANGSRHRSNAIWETGRLSRPPDRSRILEGLMLPIENALARLHHACNPAPRALRR